MRDTSSRLPATNAPATPNDLPEESLDDDSEGESDDVSGDEPKPQAGSSMERKVLNDAVAYIRGLAERHGRNADWAEEAVRDAATLTATDALEENVIAGGAGSAVNEYLSANHIATPTLNLGLPDRYIDQASQQQQLAICGLDTDGLIKSITASEFFQKGFATPERQEKQSTLEEVVIVGLMSGSIRHDINEN